jgi:hypothetical protein
MKCPKFNTCSQAICPFDKDVESRVGSLAEKCREFPKVFSLLKTDQVKLYNKVINKLKSGK